ncbi:hypothetical protein V6Z11_D10G117300 [Gossypium hirsutum]
MAPLTAMEPPRTVLGSGSQNQVRCARHGARGGAAHVEAQIARREASGPESCGGWGCLATTLGVVLKVLGFFSVGLVCLLFG